MRNFIKSVCYAAIDRGFRFKAPKGTTSLRQLVKTIDLIIKNDINLVLDVGANRGWYAYHLRKAGYRGRIIGFEPISSEHARISELSGNDPLWSNHCVALGQENGVKDFHVVLAGETEQDAVLSSFLDPIDALGNSQFTTKVTIRRLDDMLPELVPDLDRCRIFLKMDTQGFDLEVFQGAESIQKYIFMLQSELSVEPVYQGMPHYTETLNHYEQAGFKLNELFVVSLTKNENVLEYDCLMQRQG
jgi:FkbM family methyltransferase